MFQQKPQKRRLPKVLEAAWTRVLQGYVSKSRLYCRVSMWYPHNRCIGEEWHLIPSCVPASIPLDKARGHMAWPDPQLSRASPVSAEALIKPTANRPNKHKGLGGLRFVFTETVQRFMGNQRTSILGPEENDSQAAPSSHQSARVALMMPAKAYSTADKGEK